MNAGMPPSFSSWLQAHQQRARAALNVHLTSPATTMDLPSSVQPALERLTAAMRYGLASGGKHIRPVLTYAAAEAVAGHAHHPALDGAAAAVECIHAYSLIHDDLPAMDDDDLRRGQPSCHRQFDEATAILAGDALQARAFELLSTLPDVSDTTRLNMIQILSAAAGARGMVGGQAIDLDATNQGITLAHLAAMHRMKTGALIHAAVTLGALVAGALPAQREALDRYSDAIGLCFQVQDDILDVVGDTATLGKTAQADQALNKSTYPSLLGLTEAQRHATDLQQQALDALQVFGHRGECLRQLAIYIVAREY